MLKFIHTFAISLVCSLSCSLALFLCHFFCLFLRSTVKNYKQKGEGGRDRNIEEKRQKTFGIFFLFLLFFLLSLFSFFSFCALLGIYIFKWKVKLIINCEEKVAAYVFASYCQLYAFSWPVLVPSFSLSSCLYYSHTRHTLYSVRIIKSSSVT